VRKCKGFRLSSRGNELNQHRQQFPGLTNKAYFNFGGQGPLPTVALTAIQKTYTYIDDAGPFSNCINAWSHQEAVLTRSAIAAELNVPERTISLTEDVTVGCNIVLWGIDWQPGDHILLTDCEHPGVMAAVQELQQRFQLDVSTCPLLATLNDGDPVTCITNHLKPTTRLVVLSHILWNTGQVLPLADIISACRRHSTTGTPLQVLVDAAQSVGVLPVDLTALDVDFYAFTGHKWWCGPAGVGGLYVHPNALNDNTSQSLRPTFIGWRGIITDSVGTPTHWKPNGQRYEVATSSVPLWAGLRAAIALHHQWGTAQERYQHICQLSQQLWERLGSLTNVTCLKTTAPPEAGLVSFQLNEPTLQSHSKLVASLEAQSILVRTILHPSCVRACVHYLTLPEEIDRLVDAITRNSEDV
jgi:L-cysteine/cystine lyase